MRAYFLSFYAYYLQGGSRGNTGTWICGRLCSPKELEGCTCRCWGREPACRLPTRMLARAPTRHLGMVGSLPLMESASPLRPPSPLPPTPPGKIPISSWYCKLHPSINWPVHGVQKSQYRRCGCGLLVHASSCTRRIQWVPFQIIWKISRSGSWITKDTTTSPQPFLTWWHVVVPLPRGWPARGATKEQSSKPAQAPQNNQMKIATRECRIWVHKPNMNHSVLSPLLARNDTRENSPSLSSLYSNRG